MIPLPPIVWVALGLAAVAAYKYFVKGETDDSSVPDSGKNVHKHRVGDSDRQPDSRDPKPNRRSTRLASAVGQRLKKLETKTDEIHTQLAGIHQLRNDRVGDDLSGEQLPDPEKSGKAKRDVAATAATDGDTKE